MNTPMNNRIYLASKSPRRRELLRQIGVRFEPLLLRLSHPRGPDVDETPQAGETAAQYVARVAAAKARFGVSVLAMRRIPLHPVLAADTVVTSGHCIYNRSSGRFYDAASMRATVEAIASTASEVAYFYRDSAGDIWVSGDPVLVGGGVPRIDANGDPVVVFSSLI